MITLNFRIWEILQICIFKEVKKILIEKKKIDKTAMKVIIGSLPAYQLNVLIVEYATIAGRQIEHDIEVYFFILLTKECFLSIII